MADHLRKYESLCVSAATRIFYNLTRGSFTLTPQRMRMIVDAFSETLELGLAHTGQVVVRDSFNILFQIIVTASSL
jgi:hexokinase